MNLAPVARAYPEDQVKLQALKLFVDKLLVGDGPEFEAVGLRRITSLHVEFKESATDGVGVVVKMDRAVEGSVLMKFFPAKEESTDEISSNKDSEDRGSTPPADAGE